MKGHFLANAFINQLNAYTTSDKCHLSKTISQCFKFKCGIFKKYGSIISECCFCTAMIFFESSNKFDITLSDAFFITLMVNFMITPNGNFAPFREGVYCRNTHSMQATTDFITSTTEFTAGVENCHNDL